MNYTKEELARALHDEPNYPFPVPESVSFDKLLDSAAEEYMNRASVLLEIMDGYREIAKTSNQLVNEVLEKWFEKWVMHADSAYADDSCDGYKNDQSASGFYYFFEHAEEILAEIKKVGG
jgi:hypothetical protein